MTDRFLVTGGAGFIGSHIVRRLVAENHFVRVIDNFCTGNSERLRDVHAAIELIEGDLAKPNVCDRAVAGVDYVIHQAAIPSVQRSIRDPIGTNRANVTATLNLLESSRNEGVKRFVYAASSSAYGNTAVLPKHEAMPASPLSPYALQKFVGERYCKLYHELFGLETVCLRYFNVFGPAQDPNSEYSAVIPRFITRMLAQQPVTIFGDGEQSRDFTYIDNVVDANILSLQAKDAAGEVFNIGCGARFSLNQLVKELERILDLSAQVDYSPTRPGDVRDSLADIEKARAILGYVPKISFENGLQYTVEAFRRST
jgi:nucleoside-diphosphate-sugar epimerase